MVLLVFVFVIVPLPHLLLYSGVVRAVVLHHNLIVLVVVGGVVGAVVAVVAAVVVLVLVLLGRGQLVVVVRSPSGPCQVHCSDSC